ncbi:hypothetical protein BDZ88DRAFT_437621 [Geranomyces variabilis]|nr:hypothetical protein BDZ88DRAFT_437621 [Geranomyces variabilis]KAJ3136690.1 hypothetical protein HDU90_003067 [Geranomyces variabilis]
MTSSPAPSDASAFAESAPFIPLPEYPLEDVIGERYTNALRVRSTAERSREPSFVVRFEAEYFLANGFFYQTVPYRGELPPSKWDKEKADLPHDCYCNWLRLIQDDEECKPHGRIQLAQKLQRCRFEPDWWMHRFMSIYLPRHQRAKKRGKQASSAQRWEDPALFYEILESRLKRRGVAAAGSVLAKALLEELDDKALQYDIISMLVLVVLHGHKETLADRILNSEKLEPQDFDCLHFILHLHAEYTKVLWRIAFPILWPQLELHLENTKVLWGIAFPIIRPQLGLQYCKAEHIKVLWGIAFPHIRPQLGLHYRKAEYTKLLWHIAFPIIWPQLGLHYRKDAEDAVDMPVSSSVRCVMKRSDYATSASETTMQAVRDSVAKIFAPSEVPDDQLRPLTCLLDSLEVHMSQPDVSADSSLSAHVCFVPWDPRDWSALHPLRMHLLSRADKDGFFRRPDFGENNRERNLACLFSHNLTTGAKTLVVRASGTDNPELRIKWNLEDASAHSFSAMNGSSSKPPLVVLAPFAKNPDSGDPLNKACAELRLFDKVARLVNDERESGSRSQWVHVLYTEKHPCSSCNFNFVNLVHQRTFRDGHRIVLAYSQPWVAHQCGTCKVPNHQRRLLRCSRCKDAFYCNIVCQKGDWAQHKSKCVLITKRL